MKPSEKNSACLLTLIVVGGITYWVVKDKDTDPPEPVPVVIVEEACTCTDGHDPNCPVCDH
jgi:hypothetical protein